MAEGFGCGGCCGVEGGLAEEADGAAAERCFGDGGADFGEFYIGAQASAVPALYGDLLADEAVGVGYGEEEAA